MTIHEPFVAGTDLILASISFYAVYVLLRHTGVTARTAALQFFCLATASLSGAIFHAFFPLKATTLPGLLVWLITCASIAGVVCTMIRFMTERTSTKIRHRVRTATSVAILLFLGYIAFVSPVYAVVLIFYIPVLVVFTLFSFYKGRNNRGWNTVGWGLLLSIIAGGTQAAGVKIYMLDQNTLYHIIQAMALYVLLCGYKRLATT